MAANFKIIVKNNLDIALKILKKKMKDSRVMIQYQENQYFEKPSLKKRKQRKQAIARAKFESLENNNN